MSVEKVILEGRGGGSSNGAAFMSTISSGYLTFTNPPPPNICFCLGKTTLIFNSNGTINYDGMSADEATQAFLKSLKELYPSLFVRKDNAEAKDS